MASRGNLTFQDFSSYEAALQRIVAFVSEVRHMPMTAEEIDITMKFAGPTTIRGPLFLLLEPLDSHPWLDGIEKVIEDCASLRCLREAVYVCSKGTLSLITDISLLDLRPLLSKRRYAMLSPEQKVNLEKLVLDAVCQKQPDTLLVMCKDEGATGFITSNKTHIRTLEDTETPVNITAHPSHSVNFHDYSRIKRKELFKAIEQACGRMKQGSFDRLILTGRKPWCDRRGLYNNYQALRNKDGMLIQDLLLVLAELIFRGCKLPRPRIEGRVSATLVPFLSFEAWQKDWLQCLVLGDRSQRDDQDRARALLAPFFLELNLCLVRVSYFLLDHEVYWAQAHQAFLQIPVGFHDAYRTLSNKTSDKAGRTISDTLSVASLFDELPGSEHLDENQEVKLHAERLICYLTQYDLMQRLINKYGKTDPQRLEFACVTPNCKCKHRHWYERGDHLEISIGSHQRKISLLARQYTHG